jgi:hypothetical protein
MDIKIASSSGCPRAGFLFGGKRLKPIVFGMLRTVENFDD